MVNPPPNSDPTQQLFVKGTTVEVSSDDEGFRGAWYSATILEPPPRSSYKKRKKALVRFKTLLAEDGSSPLTEYTDLAFIRPLPPTNTEEDAKSGFEVNVLVDAKCRDGWWTGVIRKVLEKSRYRVYFDNPPNVIDFSEKDLRTHWDWIDGKWVRPKKQQSTGSIFSSGTAVEVNVDKENVRDVWFPAIVIKENGENSFLVKYWTSMKDDESGTEKFVVDSLHIRPSPPRYADRNYELLERVDTTYNFGWRSGVITKIHFGRRYNVFFKHGKEDKEFAHSDIRPHVEWIDGKWISKSKEVVIASDEQEVVLNANCGIHNPEVARELKCSSTTKDNVEDKTPLTKISRNVMEQPIPSVENNALLSNKKKLKMETSNGNTWHLRSSKKQTEENTVETPLSVTADQLNEVLNETSCKEGTSRSEGAGFKFTKKTVIGDQPGTKSESRSTVTATKTKRQKVSLADSKTNYLVKRKIRARKSSEGPQILKAGKEGITRTVEEIKGKLETKEVEMPIILGLSARLKSIQAVNSIQIHDEESRMEDQMNVYDFVEDDNMEAKEWKVGTSDQSRKRGRPRKSVVTSPKAFDAGRERNLAGGLADEKGLKGCISNEGELSKHKGVELAASQDASIARTIDVSVTNYKTKEVHLAIAGADENQPLSTWIGGKHFSGDEESRPSSGKVISGWNGEKGLVDVPVESLAIDTQGRGPSDDDRSLPFVKKSPVWRTIESMDVFKIVPQKPHFQPLAEIKEEFCEGSAIGIMISFAGLFEKISMLHFDDTRNTFHSIFESLDDLEKHGFDVGFLRHRLNELLSIKQRIGLHLGDKENAEREIIENTKEITEFDEEMEELEKKIAQLKERRTVVMEEKEMKNLKVGSLRLHVDVLTELIQSAKRDFKKVVTAPC